MGGESRGAEPLPLRAVAGSSWGFTIRHQTIRFAPPEAAGPQTWDGHLDLLRTSYSDWTFDKGYHV